MGMSRLQDQLGRSLLGAVLPPLLSMALALGLLATLLASLPGLADSAEGSGSWLRAQPLTGLLALMLLAIVASLLWMVWRVARIAERASEPVRRLVCATTAMELSGQGGKRLPPIPTGAAREWVELYAALDRCIQRMDAMLAEERRATDALESSNRALTQEVEAREGYLDKQTRRLQDAMSTAWQAAEAKTRVLTNTSHEIRTPLNGIIGTTELLLRSQPLTESQRSLLKTQLGAAEALLSLVDDILQLGQASSGLALQPSAFDVAAEASMVCSALQSLASSRQIGLRAEVPRDLHAARIGDRARIRQIMMGLVGNALKFTERGEVVLELGDSEDFELLIRVRDSGIGIAPDQFSRIFEPFYQIDSQVSRRYSGTGLGLAIVNEIVKAMEGRITVESTPGVGSTFCVQLPLELADPSSLAAPAEEPVASVVPGNLRVLVVDDIEMNRELLDLQVSSLGAHSVTAESGPEAIELLAAQDFDLVLLDCQMPELDGYQTARRIRARWPQRQLKIVAVTAHAQPGERERCLRSGMDDYVSKPVAMSTLERLLGATPVLAVVHPG
jgi:signal transduction histidine kinase/ActR/RegA family two-component response regulator